MRHKASFLAALAQRSPKHADALEMTKLFHQVNFAQTLQIGQAELLRYDAAEGIETVHPVTPYLCRTDQRGPHLSAGVVTALFDEVSTAACILQDKTHRPGVSVALDVEMLAHDVAPGARVRLKTWADRVGKTLAFLRLDLRDDATGRLLAVGKHCKYLPMGVPFWDAAFNPGLYPILRNSLFDMTRRHIAKGEQVEHTGSLLDHFPLEGLSMGKGSGKTTASLTIHPRHCNGLFKMHGGALAVAAEEVAVRDAAARATNNNNTTSPRARAISLHYLQANSKSVDLTAWPNDEEEAAAATGGGVSDGRRIRSSQVEARRGHRLCNTATIVWE